MLAQPERSATETDPAPQAPARQTSVVRTQAEAGTTLGSRSAVRHLASQVPSITAIRLSPHGADATLVNISTSGVLVVSTYRFRLAAPVTVVFDGTFSPKSVEGRIARSSVAGVSKTGVLRYHIGIVFDDPTALREALEPVDPPPTSAPEPQVVAPPPPVLVNRW